MNIEKLKKKRSAQKGSITRLLKQIDDSLNIDCDSKTVKILLTQLSEKISNIKLINEEILNEIDLDEVENEVTCSEEYIDNLILYKCKLNDKVEELNSKSVVTSSQIISHTPVSRNLEVNSIKLPKLNVNKFMGNSSNWLEFIGQFETAIDKNPNLSKIEKLIYLRNFLGGSAAKAIAGFALTNDNYDAALELLRSRYGQTNLLINSHLGLLLNIPPVKCSSDIIGLRNLFDRAETQIRNLESLGIDSNSYGNLLTPILLKIIPPDLTLEFSRLNKSENWDLKALLNFLREEITARERSSSVITQFSTKQNKNDFTPERKLSQSTRPSGASAHQLFINVKKCVFCKYNNHDSEKCSVLSIEQKKELLKREGRCYLCLQLSHRISECTKRIKCSSCYGKHSLALCYKFNSKNENANRVENNESNIVAAVSPCGSNVNRKDGVLLQTASVSISHNGYHDNARLLFDSGSMRSFISLEKSRKLNLPIIRKEKLSVFAFGDKAPIQKLFNVVRARVEKKGDPNSYLDLELLEIENISTAHIPPFDLNLVNKNKNLKRLYLADFCTRNRNEPISILIGADFYFSAVTGRIRKINKTLVASETLFGWCLLGKNDSYHNDVLSMKVIIHEDDISNQIKKFWDLESLGISENEHLDPLNCNIIKTFESEIKFENSRYQVRLPWKPDQKHLLNNNKQVAEQRFFNLKKRFRSNPDLFVQYQAVLQDYLKQNIIESVPDSCNDQNQIIFYLPHRAVIRNDRSTTKLRIVFDASSHDVNEISLNDCLHVGPNLYPDIFDLLLRFRLHPVAFTADLKQAFLQILVDERDRDVSRFLFTDNPFDDSIPPICYRFTRILFGLNCSPFLLTATIKHHLKQYENSYPSTFEFLNNNVYVDDVIGSEQNVDCAFRTSLECMQIFEDAGMILHKWQTNSKELEEMWIRKGIISDESLKSSDLSNPPFKVLGIGWDKRNDTLYFDIDNLLIFLSKHVNTKRFILQAVGRIFDPVGFLSPFVLRVKFIIQEIWQLTLDWDEELPCSLTSVWHKWCNEVPSIKDLRIPRYYLSSIDENSQNVNKFELHFFSDASQKAFGTVVYLRTVFDSGQIQTILIASKTRVAPLKSLTLPRLELMAALLSAKLSVRVIQALNLNLTCYFWADSTITLFWIKGISKEFKPFVKNRIDEIRKLTKPSDWYYCPGNQNPADLASRGTTLSELQNNKTWFAGPQWLSLAPESWPTQEKITIIDPSTVEYRKRPTRIQQNFCAITDDKLLDTSKYSSLTKLLRVTAWIMRFVYNSRNSIKRREALSTEEMLESEEFWIKHTQSEFYSSEILDLKKKQEIKTNSDISKFAPFLDTKGILRIKGRLEESDFDFDEKQPILLPRNSDFSKLVVKQEHVNVMHCGVAITLMKIRKKFWIPKGRQLVKRIINECIICKRYSAKPANQITAQLPKDRISITPPFDVCGTDFAGPIYVKNENDAKKIQKSYIALFTCAITRAVHLELVSKMSTKCYLLALRRFISRRGNCRIIYSDNAKAFKNADKELQYFSKILKDQELQDYFSSKGITWKFIVERAPWWGGFYERLVKAVKDPLRKVLGRALLDFEELTTVLTEIENVINSRPLTYIHENLDEPSPLTPAHFLNFGKKDFDYYIELENKISTKESLTKRKFYQAKLLKQLWIKWKTQYLLDLKTVHNFKTPKAYNNLKVGDIVLVDGTSKSKLLWDLGIVKEILPGRDNYVRACVVKVKGKLFRKPIQLLYPLETH